MYNALNAISNELVDIINHNGFAYLSEEPYRVYLRLNRNLKDQYQDRDQDLVNCFLLTSVNRISDFVARNNVDLTILTNLIVNKCFLNEDVADKLATIYLQTFSDRNREMWGLSAESGLREFLRSMGTLTLNLRTEALWKRKKRETINYLYDLKVILRVSDANKLKHELSKQLGKNKFMSKGKILNYYQNLFAKILDDEFYHCAEGADSDGYYNGCYPYSIEDFDFDELRNAIEEHGFEIVWSESSYKEFDDDLDDYQYAITM